MIQSWEIWQGPLAQTLLHFLWQGMLIAFLIGVLFRLLAARSVELQYGIGLLGLMMMAGSPLVTFYFLMPNPPASFAPSESGSVSAHHSESSLSAPSALHASTPVSAPMPPRPSTPKIA